MTVVIRLLTGVAVAAGAAAGLVVVTCLLGVLANVWTITAVAAGLGSAVLFTVAIMLAERHERR